ncbi:MAG: hypothetical protein MUF15_18235, partial [Acidobacteria bacterium]|nr:hypothetical protein [Acidobacteriota bacterium]
NEKIKLKYPDISVFFRLNDENSGEMTFAFQKKVVSFSFSLNNVSKKWEEVGDIPIMDIFNPDGDEPFKVIFEKDIPGVKLLPWLDFWDNWIKYFTTITHPASYFYETKDGKKQWLWIEKIESSSFIERMRPQPPKPQIVEVVKKETKNESMTQTIPWHVILIICIIVFFTNPISTFLFNRFRLKKVGSLGVEEVKETFDSMKKVDDDLVKRITKLMEKRKNLGVGIETQLKAIEVNEKFQKFGKRAFDYYLEEKKRGNDIKEEDWIDYQFKRLRNFEIENKDITEQLKKLEQDATCTKKEYESIFNEMGKIESIEGEKLEQRWKSVKKLLDNKDETFKAVVGNLESKEKEIYNIKENMDKVSNSISSIDNGLQRILLHSDGKDTQIAAMISFLIYYSLFHFSKAIVSNEELKKKIMLANLIKIAEKMNVPHPVFKNEKLKEFGAIFKDIRNKFPGIQPENFPRCEDSANLQNAEIIQTFLQKLKNLSNSRLDFGPFYIDVDDTGKVHQAN